MFDFLLNYFMAPVYLWLFVILGLGLVLLFGVSKNLSISRFFIITALILALAQPYSPVQLFGGGSTQLRILEDNSSSYKVFGKSVGVENYEFLKKNSNVDYVQFGEELISNVGDSVIDAMMDGRNVLLLSDGNVNLGENLEKVKELAIKENLSISSIKRDVENKDYAVSIIGPSKIGPNTEATFVVKVEGTDDTKKNVELIVDGKVVKSGPAGELEYSTKFEGGYHRLTAKIKEDDHFEDNNVYYKSVKVVEKTKILLHGSEGTPLHRSLSGLYDVEIGSLYNLDRYHAVVIDNKNVASINDRVNELETYVQKGNGLFVVGGKEAFESGSYSGSKFEELLPVEVSGSAKKEGDVNVIILIDVSSSSSSSFGTSTTIDVTKSLAISALDSVADENNLGIIAFNTEGIVVEDLGLLDDKDRNELKGLISSLEAGGSTNICEGLDKAVEMLEGKSGGKNIILISDGQTQGDWRAALGSAVEEDVNVYSVAVGENSNAILLREISDTSGGEFYFGTQVHKLSFVFGDPDGINLGDVVETKVYYNDHFITEDLILDAKVYGVNQVLPKNSAQLLVTSTRGEPLLTTWRRGLGRIAVLSGDNGEAWTGRLYIGSNSRLISRTTNWVAGDPERKKDYFVSFNDPRKQEASEIIVKGDRLPEVDNLKFSRNSDGTYSATLFPEETGFFSIENDEYSVNYNSEFDNIGMNSQLEELVSLSGGHMFEESDNINSVLDYLKEKKNIATVEKELFIWPLISLAMIIFVIDVWIRTVSERKSI